MRKCCYIDRWTVAIFTISFSLLLVGCGAQQTQFLDLADPNLTAKLGITDEDWARIKQLAASRKGLVIKDAGKVAPNVIEVEFKKPDDLRPDQGGPSARYEKKDKGWAADDYYHGYWAVGKTSL